MSPGRDLNPRPTAYQAVALPTELPGLSRFNLVFLNKTFFEL